MLSAAVSVSVNRFFHSRPISTHHFYHLPPHSLSSPASHSTTTLSSDLKSRFLEVYHTLKSDIFNDPSFEYDHDSRQRVDKMLDYNVPGGSLDQGFSVVESYKLLKEELTDDEVFLASALGWCTEWLQTHDFIVDDIMDESHTRKGQPCWFRLSQVGMIAAIDAVILRNHIPIILKKHFQGKAYYVDLLDLFNQVGFQTASGQIIDMISGVGERDLSKYSLSTYHRIAQYKTSYCLFYLPVACALLMFGEKLDDHVQVKDILLEMGIYFQVQNDYLDCFGSPEVTGKIGTDIEEFKYSWLILKAFELANDKQKKLLNENYGRKDPDSVAKVKELYNTLNLQGVFEDYEKTIHEKLIKSIEAHPSKVVQTILKSFLGKIYKRQK